MTCENYHLDASAMNLVGPQLGVHTMSYQYSNVSNVGPIMMTTADTMCTFSPMFQDRWQKNGMVSKEYIDIGYSFDASFSQLKERSVNHGDRLKKNGAKFLLTYFDENVQREGETKYGAIHEAEHYRQIETLAKLVIEHEDIAVITKPQFVKNTLSTLFPDDEILKKARSTGRFLELHHGNHRNNILPAEAVTVSAVAIGHLKGATAGLEAVLAGRRCILLNPHNLQEPNTEIFNRANILYETMDAALAALGRYWVGDPQYLDLGDWSAIIDQFDPFRDGQSSRRLRRVLEAKISA